MIQAFNQEMSLIVKEFGGFVLKYIGDAVLTFFLVSNHQSQSEVACIRAINCARCMLQVAHEGINPILNQCDCPVMNARIGIDIGENAIIQSGWDIHPSITNVEKIGNNNNIYKKEQPLIKKPVYDVLGYSTSIAVKMTALANPNHMVIGQLVYDLLDDIQKSLFRQLTMSPEIWSYANINTGNSIYNIFTNK
jgi:class 3 adenylate cyclase